MDDFIAEIENIEDEQKEKWEVAYDGNGGTNVPEKQRKIAGKDLKLSATIPIKEGFKFKGWATSEEGVVEYKPEAIYSKDEAITLYAIWQVEGTLATQAIDTSKYGQGVVYEANGISDWKVFLNDGTYVYIITSDYAPTSGIDSASGIIKNTALCIYGTSEIQLVNALRNTTYWEKYAEGINGATAVGSPSYEEFWGSYNGLYGTSYGGTNLNLASHEGANNSLYFPRASNVTDPYAYYLSSCFKGPNYYYMYDVRNNRQCVYFPATNPGNKASRGFRPLVKLPENCKMSWNGEKWDLILDEEE